ncbi:MAG TPA: Rid family detoxifying hydrolase [Gemmatimonadales bacterium]|nr:Rid family detoxifying hydrolase [Gemmatimonadales bacterium]
MDTVESTRAPEPVGPYPHARRAGQFLFVSGTGPRKRGSSEIPQGFEAQCRATLDNIGAILAEGGATWDDVVDVTVFLTNMDADFTTMNRIYAEYFTGQRPARTTVEVTKLPTPISIEIKAIACLP